MTSLEDYEAQWADAPLPEDPFGPPPDSAEATTWEPIDLGPYLRGEVEPVVPELGVRRSDGIQFLYPRKEHYILGGTESGKTWLAQMCAAAELAAGNTVAYLHFEESDPTSTVERLRLLGVSDDTLTRRLRFAAPARGVRSGWLTPILNERPSLVILDGINEAIMLHGQKVDIDGWSLFRRQVIVPFKDAGTTVLGCDHMPITNDENRRDAFGTVHKGNILDGARLMLVNKESFGRKMRGRSDLYVTKDRPGHLRNHGRVGKVPGVIYFGTLVVDDSQANGPDFVARVYAPKADEGAPVDAGPDDPVEAIMAVAHELVLGKADRRVGSKNKLVAAMQNAGHKVRRGVVYDAANRLLDSGLFIEVKERGEKYLEAVPAPVPAPSPVPEPCSPVPAVPLPRGDRGTGTSREDGAACSGNNREQPGTSEETPAQTLTAVCHPKRDTARAHLIGVSAVSRRPTGTATLCGASVRDGWRIDSGADVSEATCPRCHHAAQQLNGALR